MKICGLRLWTLYVCLLLVVSSPCLAYAQEAPSPTRPSLRLPMTAFGISALADWATTYHALKNFQVRETNPLLRPIDHQPGTMIGIGAALDAGLATGWHFAMAKNHPRIGAAGLWAATAFRTYLAIHNLRNERRSLRR